MGSLNENSPEYTKWGRYIASALYKMVYIDNYQVHIFEEFEQVFPIRDFNEK